MWKTVKSELSYIEKKGETTRARIILGMLLFFLVMPFIMTLFFMVITKLHSEDFDFMTVLKTTYMLSNTFLGFFFLYIICETIYLEKRIKLWRILPFTLNDMFLITLKIRGMFLIAIFVISFVTASIAYGKWLVLAGYQYQQLFYLWSMIFAAIFVSELFSEIVKHDLTIFLMMFTMFPFLMGPGLENNTSGGFIVFDTPAPILSSGMIIIGLLALFLHWIYYQKRTSFMK